MLSLTVAQLAELVGAKGDFSPELRVGPDVVIDSRSATPGSLFVALPGERVDGHDFLSQAAAAGAVAALVDEAKQLDEPADLALLPVPDPLAALGRLAHEQVRQQRESGVLTVLAVTGSSGKTSTKDLLAQVMAAAAPSVAAEGSHNNEIGVPLTAAQIQADTRYLVLEMGSRGIGHINQLTAIVPVDIAMVLNIGVAHLGEFGSREAIAEAKGELAKAAQHWAVLNADDELVSQLRNRTSAHIAYFSTQGPPEGGQKRVWAENIESGMEERYAFDLHLDAEPPQRVELNVVGQHQVANALAAAAAASAAGLSPAQVAAGLNGAHPASHWRMELQRRADGLLVLNDAYNANPESMRAALDSLAQLRRPGGKLIAVLGEMLELGDEAEAWHAKIGTYAAQVGVDQLYAIAGHAAAMVGAFIAAAPADAVATVVPDRKSAVKSVLIAATPDDVVLVKASRGIALETVAAEILKGIAP
ncbi:MAG: UDP-N-acetylmuramoyl-tripeptide--D-alanyl-D-alanine ligase [Propionibacteriaceae bacterium]|jgi:UDP-N-acetylmuramoyl-tripeptide--D-alanyl-D-alanine ligase|nr:UDP-N-acetylmuramoyl-tripeptide--D-alanyl-D-alanine ligase [Propionibacteriaceae bacterium]